MNRHDLNRGETRRDEMRRGVLLIILRVLCTDSLPSDLVVWMNDLLALRRRAM